MNMQPKLDWLSFTWKSGATFNYNEFQEFLKVFPEIQNVLPEHEIVKDKKGGHGMLYDTVLNISDHFYIAFQREPLGGEQANVNMGVNVSCPAHGLEYLFSLFGKQVSDAIDLIREFKSRSCQFSRIDIAFDDYSKKYDPNDYAYWFATISQDKKYNCGGRMLVTNCRKGKLFFCKQYGGDTFYLGSRDNGKLMRIYDKEYQSGGAINAIRYEFEFHTKFTPALVDYMLEHDSMPSFKDFLTSFIIAVVDVPAGKRKDQGVLYKDWVDFIESFNPPLTHSCKLIATKPEECSNKTLRKFKYMGRNCLKTYAAYRFIFGEEFMSKCVDSLEDPDFNKELEYIYRQQKSAIDKALLTDEGNINPHWYDNCKAV